MVSRKGTPSKLKSELEAEFDIQAAEKPAEDEGRRRRRPGRESGEGEADSGEEEDLTFERRAEWFLRYHTGQYGYLAGRRQALEQSFLMEAATFQELAPGGPAPLEAFELVETGVASRRPAKTGQPAGKLARTARLKPVHNPAPGSSLGFASGAVRVEPVRREEDSPLGVALKVRLDPEALERVEAETVRIFRFDEAGNEWQLVLASGVAEGEVLGEARDGKGRGSEARVSLYAWAAVQQPGTYIAIGLPRNPLQLRLAFTVQSHLPELLAARQAGKEGEMLETIRRLALYPADGAGLAGEDAELLPLAGQLPGGEDLGKVLPGVHPPLRGLPEFDLLRDMFRLKWKDAIHPIDFPFPFPPIFLGWRSLGPDNVNGRVKCVAVHPTNSDIVYAGAADGGVWRSNNAGLSWTPLMKDELSMAIGGLALAPSNPNVIYAATGEDTPGWNPSYPGVGVYKSSNGGDTWTLCAPIPSDRCTRALVHPANPNIVYVAGNGGMHKSVDGGLSWTNIRTDHVSDALLDPDSPDHLYAAVWNSGIYFSPDGGATWTAMNQGLPAGVEWIKLAMGPRTFLYRPFLIAKLGPDSTKLYYYSYWSFSGGLKSRWLTPRWVALPGNHPGAAYNEWTNLVAVDPTDDSVIIDGSVDLERSTDGGGSFTGIGGTHSDHHSLVFDRLNPKIAYLSTDGGVYRSADNGASWTLRSTRLRAAQFYSIGVSQTDPLLIGGATQDQGILKTNGSLNWTDTGAGNEGGFFIVDPRSSSNLYVTPWDGNLRRSTDGGSNWTTILTGITKVPDGKGNQVAVTINHLAVNPADSNQLLCVGGSEVFRSTDQGNNWSSVLTASGGPTRVIWRRGGSVAYVATGSGRVYRSGNRGLSGSWSEPYTSANKPPDGTITCMDAGVSLFSSIFSAASTRGTLHVPKYEMVYIGYSDGKVYRSDDSGETWQDASGTTPGAKLPDVPVNDLVITSFGTSTVYAATDIGVFFTQDYGASWQPYNWNLPRIIVSGLALRRKDQMLYASTMGRGVYRVKV